MIGAVGFVDTVDTVSTHCLASTADGVPPKRLMKTLRRAPI